jgi:hypothetical protein
LIQSRYWVQAGALACGLLTVLHLIVWYGVADGAMRFGSVIGGLICGVAAWKLWTQNSIPAALSALIMLCLEAAGAVFAASSMAKSATGGLGSSAGLFLLSVLMVGVGYQTFRSARRIRRLATKG